jgi:hypothetical protein
LPFDTKDFSIRITDCDKPIGMTGRKGSGSFWCNIPKLELGNEIKNEQENWNSLII